MWTTLTALAMSCPACSPRRPHRCAQRRIAGRSGSWADMDDQQRLNDPAAALGQQLFFDTVFALDNSVSCATCRCPPWASPWQGSKAAWPRKSPCTISPECRRPTLVLLGWSSGHALVQAAPVRTSRGIRFKRLAITHRVHEDPILRTEYESVFGPCPHWMVLEFPMTRAPMRNGIQRQVLHGGT